MARRANSYRFAKRLIHMVSSIRFTDLPPCATLQLQGRISSSGIHSLLGKALTEVSGLGLDAKMLESAAAFHAKIAKKVGERTERGYEIVAIKGILQPTSQSAPGGEGIEPLQEYGGEDEGGDGTVPRPSAHPPEWDQETTGHTLWAAQRHETLQEMEGVHTQLCGLLTTGTLGGWMGGEQIGMEVPGLLSVGESREMAVNAEDPTLALTHGGLPRR
jgi:hypothetical protein